MRTSVTTTPFSRGSNCDRNSSAEAKPRALSPLKDTKATTDWRAAASSSTTKIVDSASSLITLHAQAQIQSGLIYCGRQPDCQVAHRCGLPQNQVAQPTSEC